MAHPFIASGARRELLRRLTEALISDAEIDALVEFLRDDLAYAPDNPSIIGAVLREQEFDQWRRLMSGVRWNAPSPVDFDKNEVRALSRKLLTEMEQA